MFPSVTIVGGKGRMGEMLRAVWSPNHAVHAVDRRPDVSGKLVFNREELAAAVPAGDLVLLCVPAPAMPEVLEAVVPRMRTEQILADICSVKIKPMRLMRAAFAGPVVGAHPFFGPENERRGARVALVRGKTATDAHLETVAGLFREIGCDPFLTTAEEHDRASAVSQSLHFALAASYFATAAGHGELAPYITPSFLRYRDGARNELTRNAAMFVEFTRENPLFPEVLEEYLARLRETGSDGLDKLVREARVWFDSD